jgi:hypothetical protein
VPLGYFAGRHITGAIKLDLKWETDEEGNIRLPRLVGYQSGVADGIMLICQLRVANNVDEFRAGGTALQWAMSADQGRQIAQQLIEAADQIDEARPKDS